MTIRLFINGAVHHAARSCAARRAASIYGIGPPREREIGETGLEREGVALEPVLERTVQCLAKLRILRRVDVKIDKTGKDIASARQALELAGGRRFVPHAPIIGIVPERHGRDGAAFVDAQQRILENLDHSPRRSMKEGSGNHSSARLLDDHLTEPARVALESSLLDHGARNSVLGVRGTAHRGRGRGVGQLTACRPSSRRSSPTWRARAFKPSQRASASRPSFTTTRPSTITIAASEPRAAWTRFVTIVSATDGCR